MTETEKVEKDLNLGIKEINSTLQNTLIDKNEKVVEITPESIAKGEEYKEEGNKAFKGNGYEKLGVLLENLKNNFYFYFRTKFCQGN